MFHIEEIPAHLYIYIYLRGGSFPVKAEWKDIITGCRSMMENHNSTVKSEDALKYTHVSSGGTIMLYDIAKSNCSSSNALISRALSVA